MLYVDEARDMKGADTPPPTPIHVAPPARPSSLKLEMPKFSGQIVDWHEFWGLFDSRIERETSLSEIEKIGLLETAMTTPKALEIVREASKSRNYDKVAARIKEECDKPRQIYKYHLNQFLELKPVKDDHDSLGSFRRSIQKHLDGFQMNKGYTADQLLCELVAPLLTGLSKQKWSDYVSELDVLPSIEDLLAFLYKRVDATQEDEPVENLAFTRPISSNMPFAKKKEKCQGRVLRA